MDHPDRSLPDFDSENGSPEDRPSEEQLEEARRVYEQLIVELDTLVRERARFRHDLREAVAEGEKALAALDVS